MIGQQSHDLVPLIVHTKPLEIKEWLFTLNSYKFKRAVHVFLNTNFTEVTATRPSTVLCKVGGCYRTVAHFNSTLFMLYLRM